MGRLDGKVAIVTGAGRGIGRAIAMAFAAEGAKVAVLSRSQGPIDETVANIEAAGGTAIGSSCDVRYSAQITASVGEVIAKFGKVDILVNNAMAHDNFDLKPVMEVQTEDIDNLMQGGPYASLHMIQACVPHMNNGGSIINFGTGLAVAGQAGVLPLAMAKESIRTLTRVAARELAAQSIRVNTINPLAITEGFMEMGKKFASRGRGEPPPPPPIGRMGAPEDIAKVALFLASDDAAYITGYTHFADGGVAMDAAR